MSNRWSTGPGDLIDITRSLGLDSVPWPGARPFSRMAHRWQEFVVSTIRMTAHTGTHLDAPAHYSDQGLTVDRIPLETLLSPAVLIDCGDAADITPDLLEAVDFEDRALLLKTAASGFDREEFREDYPALTADAAGLIRDRGAKLLGIDYLSVDPPDCPHAHGILLEAGIPLLEDLDLSNASPGEYTLICLPLRIYEGEAAPARAVLAPIGLRPGMGS